MEEKKANETKEGENKSKNHPIAICQTIECGKPAYMHCPTCEKLGLPPSYFCN